ncbi:hypothetical protein DCO46_16145 [Flavobacterium sp. HTF]|nr:hypothetical protein DCO46_16145 [Flavobacterium sp. HTF]
MFSFLLVFQTSNADVIPQNSHYFEKRVKIINIDEFPDFSFIGYVKHPAGKPIKSYVINSKDYLHIDGYKFNILYIVAAKKNYLLNKNLDSLNWEKNKSFLKANIYIDTEGGYIDNDKPISYIEEYYKIVKLTKTRIVLFKCAEAIFNNDGSPYTFREFDYIEQSKSDIYPFKKDNRIVETYTSGTVFKFLFALLITIFIETLVLFLFFKTRYKKLNISNKLLLITGLVTSFSTLPYVWFVFPTFIQSRIPYIIICESFAILVESFLIYKLLKIEYKKALFISIICNLISFSIGLLINYIISSEYTFFYALKTLFE